MSSFECVFSVLFSAGPLCSLKRGSRSDCREDPEGFIGVTHRRAKPRWTRYGCPMDNRSLTHPTAVRDLWVSAVGSGCRDWQGLQAREVLGGNNTEGESSEGGGPGLYLPWRPCEPLPTGGGSEGPRGLCSIDHTQEVGI